MRMFSHHPVRRALRLVVGAAIAAAPLAPWSASITPHARAEVISKTSFSLTRGVRLTKIRYGAPNEVRILSIQPQRGPDVDVVTAGDAFPMYRLTSSMAAANDAVAGVNGDFATPYGAPSHVSMIDGELWSSGSTGGQGFAFSSDGRTAYAGTPILRMSARRFGRADIRLAEWNVAKPKGNEVRGYTVRGGSAVTPPGAWNPTATDPKYCAVRLTPTAPTGWSGPKRAALTRNYSVDAQPEPCRKTPLPLGGMGNVVLAAKGTGNGADWIRRLDKGMTVKLSWGFAGWYGVTDFVGGNPLIVDKGKNIAPDYYSGANNILWYNPRTAIGVNAGCGDTDPGTICKVWIVTVDGRQSSTGWSKGMKLPGLANELVKLGAEYAVNLDGGGSTTMWVKRKSDGYCQSASNVGGCLVNRPSRSTERVTIGGVTVLASADPGTPSGLK
jgi:hypothetical protein